MIVIERGRNGRERAWDGESKSKRVRSRARARKCKSKRESASENVCICERMHERTCCVDSMYSHDVHARTLTSIARRLDKKTKVLFLDFTYYNDDVGLFVSCSMQVEFVSGHAPVTTVQASGISPMRFRSGRMFLRVH